MVTRLLPAGLALTLAGCMAEGELYLNAEDTDAGPRPVDARVTPATDARVTPANDARVTPAVDAHVTPAVDVPVDPGTGPSLGGCPLLPFDNAWNQDISDAPVHPRSDAIIANIQDHGDSSLKADFGASAQYGIPFTVVAESQAMVPVRFTLYPDESDPGPYPIPTGAAIEAGGDHHLLVLQSGTCRLFELYRATRGGTWSAGSGAVFDLRSNATRPEGWTSTDQAGLPILPGLARYDEVAAGEIRHALRVTFEHTRAAWVAPATHQGGEDDDDAPPMGLRLRLRADYNVAAMRGAARVIARALQRYGVLVADTGTNWYISGATDRRWNDADLEQLTDIPGTAFEVVDTGPIRQP